MKKLFIASGEEFEGKSFGADIETQGEVVFTTGMTGYLEILTDPSYYGQIVVFTFPLIGNYGVQSRENFLAKIDKTYESEKIWVKGVIVCEESKEFSHNLASSNFANWLKENNIPALCGVDTRNLTRILREKGTIQGTIGKNKPKDFIDKLGGRYVPEVSPKSLEILHPEGITDKPKNFRPLNKTIAFIDCGAKNGIFREFLSKGIRIIRVPFDYDISKLEEKIDGIFISNGPGDPSTLTETIENVRNILNSNLPVFGICLGNQIIALAAGGKTKKMPYGHRSVNQPVQEICSQKCLITTQNHGYEIDDKTLPADFEVWFKNLNDGTNEGIRHKNKDIFSVQFHPEACAGPEDAKDLFDKFINKL